MTEYYYTYNYGTDNEEENNSMPQQQDYGGSIMDDQDYGGSIMDDDEHQNQSIQSPQSSIQMITELPIPIREEIEITDYYGPETPLFNSPRRIDSTDMVEVSLTSRGNRSLASTKEEYDQSAVAAATHRRPESPPLSEYSPETPIYNGDDSATYGDEDYYYFQRSNGRIRKFCIVIALTATVFAAVLAVSLRLTSNNNNKQEDASAASFDPNSQITSPINNNTASPSTTTAVVPTKEPTTNTKIETDLELVMTGMKPMKDDTINIWETTTEKFVIDYYDDDTQNDVSSTNIKFNSQNPPYNNNDKRKRILSSNSNNLRFLNGEDTLKIQFTQTLEYNNNNNANSGSYTELALIPFDEDESRYIQKLKESGNKAFEDLTGVSVSTTAAAPPIKEGTSSPTMKSPTSNPTDIPTTSNPTTKSPTSKIPTTDPTNFPTTSNPTTKFPTSSPSKTPTISLSGTPTTIPSISPTTKTPTNSPTENPTAKPSRIPTAKPSILPSARPSKTPTEIPTTLEPTTASPTLSPPTRSPTRSPTRRPTRSPTRRPTTRRPTTTSPTVIPRGTIAGSVRDNTNNGIEGVTIVLKGIESQNGNIITPLTTQTNSIGVYFFTNILIGNYILSQTNIPNGYRCCVRDIDDTPDGIYDMNNNNGDNMISVTLSKDKEVDDGNNFVNYKLGIISGSVRDSIGQNIHGVKITLKDFVGTTLQTTRTGIDGMYEFINLESGNYLVEQENKVGYRDVSDRDEEMDGDIVDYNYMIDNTIRVFLKDGEVDSGNNFVDVQVGSISGTVTDQSTGAGMSDIQIALYDDNDNDNDDVVLITRTNAVGYYIFENILPKSYTIEQTANAIGYIDVSDRDEIEDGDTFDRDATVDNKIKVTIRPGENDSGNNFVDVMRTNTPTTAQPTTPNPTTASPTTPNPTGSPTTSNPTTANPTTLEPTTPNPTTLSPTTRSPTTAIPTKEPTTMSPTKNPTTNPTTSPTLNPTNPPTTSNPTTEAPTTSNPTTEAPTTSKPTSKPTTQTPTLRPTPVPTTEAPVFSITDCTPYNYLSEETRNNPNNKCRDSSDCSRGRCIIFGSFLDCDINDFFNGFFPYVCAGSYASNTNTSTTRTTTTTKTAAVATTNSNNIMLPLSEKKKTNGPFCPTPISQDWQQLSNSRTCTKNSDCIGLLDNKPSCCAYPYCICQTLYDGYQDDFQCVARK